MKTTGDDLAPSLARLKHAVTGHPATDQENPAVRKIICFTHATLDGYIDDPHEWSFPYSDEELRDYGLKMTLAADALLLGRITYEGMAQAWPTRGGNPFADTSTRSPSTSSPPNRSTPRRGIRPWSSPAPTCSTRSAD